MNRPVGRRSPAGTGRRNFDYKRHSTDAWAVLYGSGRPSPYLPRDWRIRVNAQAESYYRAHVEKLGQSNAAGWAQGHCPFHEDSAASLSVNLMAGRWRCFASCGAGDLLSFHMRVTGMGFKAAVRDLLGLRP